MKRIINIALIIMVLTQVSIPAVQAESKSDLVIPVRFLEDVDTKGIEEGNAIPLEITQDIYVDGKLLFKQGGAGYAEIAELRRAGFLGRGGKITIRNGKLSDIKGVSHNISLSANSSGDHKASALGGGIAGAGLAYDVAHTAIVLGQASAILIGVGFIFLPIAFLFSRGNEARLSCGKIMFARLI